MLQKQQPQNYKREVRTRSEGLHKFTRTRGEHLAVSSSVLAKSLAPGLAPNTRSQAVPSGSKRQQRFVPGGQRLLQDCCPHPGPPAATSPRSPSTRCARAGQREGPLRSFGLCPISIKLLETKRIKRTAFPPPPHALTDSWVRVFIPSRLTVYH